MGCVWPSYEQLLLACCEPSPPRLLLFTSLLSSLVGCFFFFFFPRRTALIVGGGDGVGKLHDIATNVSPTVIQRRRGRRRRAWRDCESQISFVATTSVKKGGLFKCFFVTIIFIIINISSGTCMWEGVAVSATDPPYRWRTLVGIPCRCSMRSVSCVFYISTRRASRHGLSMYAVLVRAAVLCGHVT